MIKLVAEMRRNAYPNASRFVKMLKDTEQMENLNIACVERTIMRDIDALKKDFNAPIKFSQENNGYYLANPYWEFQTPFMEEDMVVSLMLGVRLAEDMMPSPVKEKISNAVNAELANNNSEFFEKTFMESFLEMTGTKTAVEPGIFNKVFDAWRQRRLIHMCYKKGTTGEVSERDFEPHILACHKGSWYMKGVDQRDDKIAVFAVHRIQSLEIKARQFEINRSLVEKTRKEGLFDYPKIEGITVRCSQEIAYYLREQRKAKKLKITKNDDGTLTVILPPSPEHEAIRWILGEGGNVEVIAPADLRRKIHDFGIEIANVNAL